MLVDVLFVFKQYIADRLLGIGSSGGDARGGIQLTNLDIFVFWKQSAR